MTKHLSISNNLGLLGEVSLENARASPEDSMDFENFQELQTKFLQSTLERGLHKYNSMNVTIYKWAKLSKKLFQNQHVKA